MVSLPALRIALIASEQKHFSFWYVIYYTYKKSDHIDVIYLDKIEKTILNIVV